MHTDWDAQRERLSAYLDGELNLAERADLEAHLSGCAECQRELASLRQMKALLGALPAPALPRSFALPETLRPLPARRAPEPRWSRPLQALGGLAAVIGLGFLITAALPHVFPTASGGASYASSTSYGDIKNGNPNSGGAASPSTPPPTSPGANSGIESPVNTPAKTTPPAHVAQPFPALPVTGGVLLVGGAAALTLGSLARRRSRDAGLPEPEPAE